MNPKVLRLMNCLAFENGQAVVAGEAEAVARLREVMPCGFREVRQLSRDVVVGACLVLNCFADGEVFLAEVVK